MRISLMYLFIAACNIAWYDELMKISYLVILSIITSWGLWAFFAKLAVEKIGLQTIFWGTLATVILVTLYLSVSKELLPLKGDSLGLGLAILSGILAGVGTILFYNLLSKNPAGLVITITALYPLVTIILSVMFLKEPLSITKVVGFIMALGALFLLNLP